MLIDILNFKYHLKYYNGLGKAIEVAPVHRVNTMSTQFWDFLILLKGNVLDIKLIFILLAF